MSNLTKPEHDFLISKKINNGDLYNFSSFPYGYTLEKYLIIREMFSTIYIQEIEKIIKLLHQKQYLDYKLDSEVIFEPPERGVYSFFLSELGKNYYELYLKNNNIDSTYITIFNEMEFELDFRLNSNFEIEKYLTNSNKIFRNISKLILEIKHGLILDNPFYYIGKDFRFKTSELIK